MQEEQHTWDRHINKTPTINRWMHKGEERGGGHIL
jgi:hypothetical protein